MEEIFYLLLGLAGLYAIIHFFFVQHSKTWKNRTTYEKIITVAAIVFISLILIGTMMD